MKNYECKSLVDAVQTALTVTREWGDHCGDPTIDVWYRGANNRDFDLVPSAYRRVVDENIFLSTFEVLAGNYIETSHYDRWDFYSLARHYGLPTRLLDWTEGIVQSLFFAFDEWKGTSTPCIWMICPHGLNQLAAGTDSILLAKGKFTRKWLPPLTVRPTKRGKNRTKVGNDLPIAIYPRRSNPRIYGQQGVYTVHGFDRTPLNALLASQQNCDKLIARIDLVGFDADLVRRDLMYLGLRQAVIYPDTDHLAKDIKYLYQLQ